MKLGLIDIHQHVVFGMDDGAQTLQETEAMLKAAYEQGTIRIVATPHAKPGQKHFEYDVFLDRLNELNRRMWQQKCPLRLLPGAEIFYSAQTVRQLDQKEIPTLAMSRNVLVEFYPSVKQDELFKAMRDLINGGYSPVLAHVERYQCLHNQWKLIEELQHLEVRIQMNAQTVLHSNGLGSKRFIRKLLEDDVVDFVATDAHNTTSRPIKLAEAYAFLEKNYGAEKADRLTWQNQLQLTPALDASLQ